MFMCLIFSMCFLSASPLMMQQDVVFKMILLLLLRFLNETVIMMMTRIPWRPQSP